jgi:hypothetical protein
VGVWGGCEGGAGSLEPAETKQRQTDTSVDHGGVLKAPAAPFERRASEAPTKCRGTEHEVGVARAYRRLNFFIL